MVTIGIDTSCDETSVSILQDDNLVVQEISSQVMIQKHWGGVVPMLARRLHRQRVEFIITKALYRSATRLKWSKKTRLDLHKALSILSAELQREEQEMDQLKSDQHSYRDPSRISPLEMNLLKSILNPGVDLLAVTIGPGLAMALEIGVKAAQILSESWQIPIALVNHMEGHFWSGMIRNIYGRTYSGAEFPGIQSIQYPVLGLLVSGNHTELVLSKEYGQYQILGQTLDDAAGEAFDKVAVMLGLGYPGGAVVEEIAKSIDKKDLPQLLKKYQFPVPMLRSGDLNFSYSGLKTAVLYYINKHGDINKQQLAEICAVFQETVVQSLRVKLANAIENYKPVTLVVGGGVFANNKIRKMITEFGKTVKYILPDKLFVGDNASMIALVGRNNFPSRDIVQGYQLDRLPSLVIDEKILDLTAKTKLPK